MFKLDNDFLTSLGLGGLPVDEKNKLLQMIYERLEMNVGMRLAEKMTDQQLDEFEAFIDQNDEAGALKWLESNFPNYKDVVAEELEKLRVEVTQAAPQILAAQSGGAGQPPMMSDPMMPGVPQPQAMPMMAPQPAFQQPQPIAPQQQQPFYDQPMQPHMQAVQPEPVFQQPAQPVFDPAPQPSFDPMPMQPQPSFDLTSQPVIAPAQPQPFAPQPDFSVTPQVAPSTQPAIDPFQQPRPPMPSAMPEPEPDYPTQPPIFNHGPQPAPGFQAPGSSQPQQFTPPPPGFNPGQ
jgi:Protein of unknown function (DUF5663)